MTIDNFSEREEQEIEQALYLLEVEGTEEAEEIHKVINTLLTEIEEQNDTIIDLHDTVNDQEDYINDYCN